MRRPHSRTRRGAPAPDAAILCALLQRNQNAPIVERRCATHTPGSAEWTHRVACHGRRATSPICSNLSFRHTQVAASLGLTSEWILPSYSRRRPLPLRQSAWVYLPPRESSCRAAPCQTAKNDSSPGTWTQGASPRVYPYQMTKQFVKPRRSVGVLLRAGFNEVDECLQWFRHMPAAGEVEAVLTWTVVGSLVGRRRALALSKASVA
jgi:hypothetical protein